jgi:hypothetical protein
MVAAMRQVQATAITVLPLLTHVGSARRRWTSSRGVGDALENICAWIDIQQAIGEKVAEASS